MLKNIDMEREHYEDCIANLTQAIQTLLGENAALVEKHKVTEVKAQKLDKKITELETKLEKLRDELKS